MTPPSYPPSHFLTKDELIRELGISKSTFYRWLRALDIKTTRHMVSAKEAHRIREALGCLPNDPARK